MINKMLKFVKKYTKMTQKYLIFKKFNDIIVRQNKTKGERMLKKLSLAAVIAMGTMSVASATPLTEAIKNVDLNGFLRVRFYNENPKDSNQYDRWRTNGVFIFKVPVSENMKFVVRNSVETNIYTDEDSFTAASNVDPALVNNLLFMQYSNGPVNAIVGKIPVATSITSADPATPGHGAGIIATYKVNDNFTAGAAFVDALKNPGENLIGNDVYAAVAVFNVDMVKGNAWYYKVTNLLDYIFTASVDVTPVENLDIHADFAAGNLDDDVADDLGVEDNTKTYYNIAASYKMDQFCAKIGYAYTDKDAALVDLSVDAPIGAVITTANNYNIANLQDTSSVYGKIGYNVDAKTNVYLAAQVQNAGDDSANENNDLNEYTIGANYKANKKLSFNVYYDIADWDKDADFEDNKEFRFEAKYSF